MSTRSTAACLPALAPRPSNPFPWNDGAAQRTRCLEQKCSQSSQALTALTALTGQPRGLVIFFRAGLAHLTEHMLFEGSLHYPEPGDFR